MAVDPRNYLTRKPRLPKARPPKKYIGTPAQKKQGRTYGVAYAVAQLSRKSNKIPKLRKP